MTREDVLKLFPEATDEQVTNLLNKSNSEVAREKEKAEKLKSENGQLKADNEKLSELQKQIDDAETAKLSEMEKMTKALETANNRVAELEKKDVIRSMRDEAMVNYKITAEQAKQVVRDDGSYDGVFLGQIISEKESAAALAKEQEIANAAANPNGISGGENENNSVAVDIAKASAKRAGTANESILNNYRR